MSNRCVREPSDLSRLRGRSPRSKSAAGGGKHTYSARRSCPHLNPPPASGGGSAPPAQQYQPNFIVRRPSHGERSRSVKARKDANRARRHSINRIRRPVEMSPRPDAAKRPDEPVSPNNQPRPELREPAKTQQPGLHKNEEPLDQQQAHRIGGGHHCHAGDPVAFADHGDRDELERLYQADGHGQQRERLIRSQSLDCAPKLPRPLPDPTRNQCCISLVNCAFFAL